VTEEERYIHRALDLATGALGTVFPNPLVGAVIVSRGEIVGEGYHRGPGKPHAEREAIARAGEKARGSTLYLNLEPCCHYGKTPPCTEAILESGIARVVFSIYDPDPRVRGKGAALLRECGIETATGILAANALELNLPYVHRHLTGRTFVMMKLASTLDGRLTAEGKTWLTGECARRYAHFLRAWTESIAVGIGTVENDDPILDRRHYRDNMPPPLRIVFDTSLRFPPDHPWIMNGERTILYCGEDADTNTMNRLTTAGAVVVPLPVKNGELNLSTWLNDVGDRGIVSVLVEGGGRVATSILREDLAERIVIIYAPFVSGESGVALYGDRSAPGWLDRGELVPVRLELLEEDAVLIYDRRRIIDYLRFVTEEEVLVHGID
jgi:diaminohydroxyphosphoribosylaminopyrimidine deaminase/5-amino-6-(5-phosphoribosylamino)uracil reductase